ncbi:TetR family transcriptional regulator [Atlantibacter hermannii]|uniref:TetR family transcriptional regulator n=1 Tax=Atlantibacter hermannii TaxID=565 RepID=UPI0034D3D819
MSYYSREVRRQMILETAVHIAYQEGLSAMTVRRVAQEAQIAIGQIHHHFSSAAGLRSEAFKLSVEQALNLLTDAGEKENASYFEMLSWCLFTENHEEAHKYSKLWKEAEVISFHDENMRDAFRCVTGQWHTAIVDLLEKGALNNEFRYDRPKELIAWNLIAYSHGLDGIFSLGIEGFSHQEYKDSTESFIRSQVVMVK